MRAVAQLVPTLPSISTNRPNYTTRAIEVDAEVVLALKLLLHFFLGELRRESATMLPE